MTVPVVAKRAPGIVSVEATLRSDLLFILFSFWPCTQDIRRVRSRRCCLKFCCLVKKRPGFRHVKRHGARLVGWWVSMSFKK